jgi:uncharacterized membrane protein (UPF0127 family)
VQTRRTASDRLSPLSAGAQMGLNTSLIERKRRKEVSYCVFNKTRESFLSLSVSAADTHFARLKGLVGKLRLKADEGIWVVPSQGIHTFGVLFSVDLIYLDSELRVVHLIESFPRFRIGPIKRNCTSVLELTTRTIYSSQTQMGDQLLICSPEEMEEYLRESHSKVHTKAM